MEKMELGVALIRRIDERIQWLGQYNENHQQVNFVTASRLENESWREIILREVAWKLDIDRKRDFVVSSMAQLNVDFSTTLPGRPEPTQIAAAFYNVELYRKAVFEKISANPEFVWLTSGEICNGVTADGVSIDPLVVLLNEHAKVIQHWESDVQNED